ncbi:putative XS domain-containing protein [Rosa chinensis]|uniref:Putative XS domain-containing protein n=1 Tax=Rosa chinensis TaxID=74649 RepID=A0A2P6SBY3_ROSCH|nr:uncharacterized protein LOC112190722 [Rosa chinensis]PRQ56182.1 putative XS domain-containing protein [Rosa chinensis]
MQPRRHESFNRQQPPASKLRPTYRFESGANNHPYSSGSRRRPEEVHRNIRRSLSPQQDHLGVSQRNVASIQREYGWHLGRGGGGRTDGVRRRRSTSGSPLLPFGEMRKMSQFEEEEEDGDLRRSYSPPPQPPVPVPASVPLELKHRRDSVEAGNYSVNDDLNGRRVYGSEHNDFGISKEDLNESRLTAGGKHGTLGQKPIHMEDSAVRGSKTMFIKGDTVHGAYHSSPSLGTVITQGARGGHLPSSTRSMSIRHSDQERLQYADPISLDRLPVTEAYKEGNKPVFPTRDGFYSMMSGSHSKNYFASSSTGLRNEFQDSYQHEQHMPSLEEFSRSSRKLKDSVSINAYRERPVVEFSRDPDSGQKNLTFYQRDSPTRVEYDDDYYFYPNSRGMIFDDRELPSDHLHKVMHPRAPLDYDHSRMGYDHRTVSRSSTMLPVVERIDNTEDYSGNSRKRIMLNNSTLERHTLSDYPDISRISNASKQSGEYMGSGRMHDKFGRRISQDYETSHLGAAQVCQISHLKEDYGYERDGNLKFQDRQCPVSKYDPEMHRNTIKMQSMRDKLGVYEPSDRVVKRKYVNEEHGSIQNPREIMSGKWNTSREFQDLYDSGEEWNGEDVGSMYTSRSARLGHNEHYKAQRKYAGIDQYDEFASDDRLPSQDSLADAQRHSVRYYKHGDRYAKGHQNYGSLSRHRSQQVDIKSGFHKQHKVWKRNDNYLEDVHRGDDNDADTSENGLSSAAPEPSEDSEEFMQLVQEAFLTYSKQLNMNPGVRRRYMEQGKAGTLFCIVCGRSFSKEFMDTQRLVTHAFMSKKAGLRTQHLGLLKAVCALLGWSTVIPTDIVLWVPQVLPKAEALAQKEDLILWPPVIIIHNISMSDNNPENWKVVSIEALEAFLRGKGLIRGRIKMCLGKPADQSVVLVKFLGTFTGLGNAERIHKYFAEQNRGRADFERATSNNGKIVEAGMQVDSVEERFLHGYMGIAEDLDKVDFNTRNWSLIKSKKEIQDLANAPVKP